MTKNDEIKSMIDETSNFLVENSEFSELDNLRYESNKLCSTLETATYNFYNETLTEGVGDKIAKGVTIMTVAVVKAIDKLIEYIHTLVIRLQSKEKIFILTKDMEVHKSCFGISIGSIISKLKNNEDIELDDKMINKKQEDKINKLDLIKTLHELKRGLQDIKKIEPNKNTSNVIKYINSIIKDINTMLTNSVTEDNDSRKSFKDYLKKYNYVGNDKNGTITVDGEKYKINIEKTSLINVDGDSILRQTSSVSKKNGESVIYIDRLFRNAKNDKDRDSILQHEIAHVKYHNIYSKNTPETTKARYESALKNVAIGSAEHLDLINMKIRAEIKKDLDKNDKIRDENLKKYNKYKNSGPHADRIEFEADKYSDIKTGTDNIINAVKQLYKDSTKKSHSKLQIEDIHKFISESKSINKEEKEAALKLLKHPKIYSILKNMTDKPIQKNDIKSRSAALKDNTIDDSPYK